VEIDAEIRAALSEIEGKRRSSMKPHEQIEALEGRIRKGAISDEEILREVHALLFAFDDASYQEKIRNAHDWANKYFSPSQSDQFGSRDMVRSHLLQELELAGEGAKELEGG
jgi:hypothetical protein